MNFDMRSPCGSCPFRRDIAFYLHRSRRSKIATALLFGDQTFACHKTVDHDRWSDEATEHYTHGGGEQHCAGALLILAKQDHLRDNAMLRIAAEFGLLDLDALNLDAPVFESMQEFVEGGPVSPTGEMG